jgi:hypothetical protein
MTREQQIEIDNRLSADYHDDGLEVCDYCPSCRECVFDWGTLQCREQVKAIFKGGEW